MLKFWDKQTIIYPPVGAPHTPQDIFAQYGWTSNPNAKVVIDHDDESGMYGAIYNFGTLKAQWNVTEADPDLALEAIKAAMLAAQTAAAQPTAEERMAAALEFQNLLNM